MAQGDEHEGDYFEGASERERKVGRDSQIVVDVFKRLNKTHFFRVSLRSIRQPKVITRYEVDVEQYNSESEFLKLCEVAGGAIAEHQCTNYGDRHDPDECAKAAREAAAELLHELP